jgi:hypothetical protein
MITMAKIQRFHRNSLKEEIIICHCHWIIHPETTGSAFFHKAQRQPRLAMRLDLMFNFLT